MTRIIVPGFVIGVLLVLALEWASAGDSGRRSEDPVRVLRLWDEHRERALLAADEDRLRGLYVPGAEVGAADVAMLHEYAERGWRLAAVHNQVFSVDTLEQSPRRIIVQVIDRFAGGSVVGPRRCRVLPHGRPVARVVQFRRTPAGWLVAEVTPAG